MSDEEMNVTEAVTQASFTGRWFERTLQKGQASPAPHVLEPSALLPGFQLTRLSDNSAKER